ncbi:MAG: PKD domain-containing protein, partial [bacterium]
MYFSRYALYGACVAALTASVACQSGTTTPTAPGSSAQTTPPLASFTPAYAFSSGSESMVAAFNVTVDPTTMTASATPIAGRSGSAQVQARSFDLDLANFSKPDSFRINGFFQDGDGDFQIYFSHKHPFAAPNLALPITAANRADLGYTARLIILADSAHTPYFGGAVTLDDTTVKDADGYMEPGDLLQQTGFTNTAFPFKLLADEALDNRVGVSNLGVDTGSYTAATGGWQRDNIGPTNTGWTGYDYIHGGQEVNNHFTLYADALNGSGPLNFAVAIMLKYTDPRGQGGKVDRLPFAPTDISKFAYRCPFAAIDVSEVSVPDALAIDLDSTPSVTVDVAVRDWDAAATVSTDADPDNLSNELDVSKVQTGANGFPAMIMDASSVGGPASAAVAVKAGAWTGRANDPVQYSTSLVVPAAGSLAEGTYNIALQVTDPENALNDDAYHYGVDPNNVAIADPARALQLRTFQVFQVTASRQDVPVITAVDVASVSGSPLFSGVQVQFTATVGPAADTWSWDFGGGTFPATSTDESPLAILLAPGTYDGSVTATNADGASAPFAFQYTVDPNGTGANPIAVITRPGTTPPVGSGIWDAANPYPATTDTKPIYLNRTQSANFDGSDSVDPDGVILHWDWDFENVVTDPADLGVGFGSDLDAEDPPTHAYLSYGSTFASLRVTDNDNLTGFNRREVIVTPFEPQRRVTPFGASNLNGSGFGTRRTPASRNAGYIITGAAAVVGVNNPAYYTANSADGGASWSAGLAQIDT